MGAVTIPMGGGSGISGGCSPLCMFQYETRIGQFLSGQEMTVSHNIQIPQSIQDISDYLAVVNTPSSTNLTPWYTFEQFYEVAYPETKYSDCGATVALPLYSYESYMFISGKYIKRFRFYKNFPIVTARCYYTGSGTTWGTGVYRDVLGGYYICIDSKRVEVDELVSIISSSGQTVDLEKGFYLFLDPKNPANDNNRLSFNSLTGTVTVYITAFANNVARDNVSTKFVYVDENVKNYTFRLNTLAPLYIYKLKIS